MRRQMFSVNVSCTPIARPSVPERRYPHQYTTRAFPPLLVHLVASGEASGKLEQMLNRAARLEIRALERRFAVFLTLLEPVMILLMGAVVLMIVLAILLPIIEINQLVR